MVELDHQASTAEAPYGIITADCSSPREIDDGIFVEALPTAEEAYRVGVCVVDASQQYNNPTSYSQAMDNTEARYWELPGGEIGYDPMIDAGVVKRLDFTEGKERNALIISFIVGKHIPPSDVSINFGQVEVTKNLNYKEFWRGCLPREPYEKFGRASALIIGHLRFQPEGDYDKPHKDTFKNAYYNLVNSQRGLWLKGSLVNQSYMVAANHLVAETVAAEGRPAIYRVHDPNSGQISTSIPPDVARYSLIPGKHAGLNLDMYSRVTSPLRRLEDFMMNYQLRQRHLGHVPTEAEVADLNDAVTRLNQRVAQNAAMSRSLRGGDVVSRISESWDDENVIELRPRQKVAAIA